MEAAARLEVRRPLRRPARRPTSGRARAGWATTRDRVGREVMGWLEGGYQTLIDALEREIVALGGEVHAGATGRADRRPTAGAPSASSSTGAFRRFDLVLCTLAPPMARRLLAPELARARAGRPLPLPRRRLPAAPDVAQRQPVLPPEHHRPARAADDGRRDDARRRPGGGRRPPALRLQVRRPGSSRPRARRRDELEREYLGYARTIFPDLRDDEIVSKVVQRARVTEPVHLVGGAARLPGHVLRARASRSPRRRTSTRRSSAARP